MAKGENGMHKKSDRGDYFAAQWLRSLERGICKAGYGLSYNVKYSSGAEVPLSNFDEC